MVAAQAGYCGQRLQDLPAQSGGEVLPPGQASPKRLLECEAVPLEP